MREFELKDGSRIVIVGGGPAGAFFAIHFLKQADHLDRKADIIIVEKKIDLRPHDSISKVSTSSR